MQPTTQQAAFVSALTDTRSNLALVARAGTGKTSTILLGVDAYAKRFPNAEVLVCAYNKAIAKEVEGKLIARGHTDWRKVQSATIHSLGFGLLKRLYSPKIDDKKVSHIISTRNGDVFTEFGNQINALVGYAKGAGVGFFNDAPIGDVSVWHALANHYDVNGLDDTSAMDDIVEASQQVYRLSLAQTDVIDFNDMVLMPLVKNLRVRFGKDLIILDEAQDLSRARQALAKKFIKPGGRMAIVGDDRQAIYGFSGADADALENLTHSLNAERLPLNVTWRCPVAVVREAQRYVFDIEAAPGNVEGSVNYAAELPADLKAGDAILCRNTAPLITAAYKLIRSGKSCKVEGRAIGEGLIKLVMRWKVSQIDNLIRKTEDYCEREMQKAIARDDEAKAEEVKDKCDTLLEICHAVLANGKTHVNDVKDAIESLFGEDVKDVIVLATYHRSKGREWRRVYLWEHSTRCPSRAAKQAWQIEQENNLAYVAITRAMETLTYVG